MTYDLASRKRYILATWKYEAEVSDRSESKCSIISDDTKLEL